MLKLKALLIFVLVFLCSHNVFAVAPVQSELAKGFVQVYDYGTLKLHAYQTADAMQDQCFALESDKGILAIEAPAFKTDISAWQNYLKKLNKPVTGVFFSAHPGGNEWSRTKIYATKVANDAMSAGATKELVNNLGKTFGPDFNTAIIAPNTILESGKNTIDGIDFILTDRGNSYDLAIPAIKAIYIHMYGADSHSILTSQHQANSYLANLIEIKKGNYEMILSSHHTPELANTIDAKIAYVKKVSELAIETKDKENFIKQVKENFPDYKGLKYLDMTANAFFKD